MTVVRILKISFLINSSNWQLFRIKVLCQVPHREHTESNGKNSCGREVLKSRGKGTRREALPEGDKSCGTGGSPPGQES